jgi:trimeric autotransporter adhesin
MNTRRMFSFVLSAILCSALPLQAQESKPAPKQTIGTNAAIGLRMTATSLIFPDGSVLSTATNAPGGTPTGTALVTALNSGSTVGTINDNRLAPNLARVAVANSWSALNTFNGGINMNNNNIANVGNPAAAGDAVNKAYADANFVQFVPGAEQLSVGDANGTAPMINLRGGSTCCSGPGGHTPAWFKVFQNGSFVATGNLGIGVSPMQGKGYRTSWDSYKGAFRSGYADAEWDDANVGFFSWAGGSNSTAIGLYALAFGDTNSAESTSSIVFGSGNQVKGAAGFSAGAGNRVCDTYGVALGNNAKSGGPLINGKCDPDTFNIRGLAAVAIGYNVTADQDHTTAMGKFASNNGFSGTFIWSDGAAQASADTFRNTANNEFAARATGGFRFRTNLGGTTGCNLPAGSGVFNCTSSKLTKENFVPVDGEDVLAKLRGLQVSTWNYITEGPQVRHIGPMAEDFHRAFALGTDNKSIGVQDLASVSIAAIQALEARTAELEAKTAEVAQLRAQLATFEERLAALEGKK